MSKLAIKIDIGMCAAMGACQATAPQVFHLGDRQKARVVDPAAAPVDEIVRAARCCPRKAITVIDEATQSRLYPE
jgi:ferredoxin